MNIRNTAPSLLLFSQDKRLAQTRHWLLEQARFQMETVYSMTDLDAAAHTFHITVFLLCNSLSAEQRAEAMERIRSQWPEAKVLVFVPAYPFPDLPADEFFSGMDGPDKLIQTVRRLISNDQPSVN